MIDWLGYFQKKLSNFRGNAPELILNYGVLRRNFATFSYYFLQSSSPSILTIAAFEIKFPLRDDREENSSKFITTVELSPWSCFGGCDIQVHPVIHFRHENNRLDTASSPSIVMPSA